MKNLIAILLLLLASSGPSIAAESSTTVLSEATDALREAAVVVGGVSKSVFELLNSGYRYLSNTDEEEERAHLIELSARMSKLAYGVNENLVATIDRYLELDNPSIGDWNHLTNTVFHAISEVQKILADIQADRSEFVLQESYLRLQQSLSSRSTILGRVFLLPQPSTSAEKEELREMNVQYKLLILNLKEAIRGFNAYVRKMDA